MQRLSVGMPAALAAAAGPGVVITEELATRPRRQPDLLSEAAAARELAAIMVSSPGRAVQRFLDLAVELCDAGTAGLSLLQEDGPGQHFYWDTLSGALADNVGGTTPRNFSPCGLCLDAGHTILLRRPFELFDYFNGAAQPLMEGLIVPLYDTGGLPLGTIWVVHHDPDKHFDAEDARVMEQFAVQLVLALKLRQDRSDARAMRREVKTLREEKAELIDESAFLQGVLSSSEDCIKVLDLAGHMLFMSLGGFKAMEVDDFERLRGRYWPDFWEGPAHDLALAAVQSAVNGEQGHFQGLTSTIKGTPKFWDVRVTPIRDGDGTPRHLLVISRDITEENRAHEERQLLARELEHRVKNSLSMVIAVINQTFRTSESLSEAQPVLLSRITALARTYDILAKGTWKSASIEAVVEAALAPHRTGAGRFRISGPPATILSAKRAQSLSLALHELATNAAKYGALSNDEGHVDLTWAVSGDGEGGTLRLRWQEHNGPAVTPPQRRGFGSRLIERVLPADFAGEVRIEFNTSGVVCELNAPVGNSQPSRG